VSEPLLTRNVEAIANLVAEPGHTSEPKPARPADDTKPNRGETPPERPTETKKGRM